MLAKNLKAPRLSSMNASSLTFFASKLAPTVRFANQNYPQERGNALGDLFRRAGLGTQRWPGPGVSMPLVSLRLEGWGYGSFAIGVMAAMPAFGVLLGPRSPAAWRPGSALPT